METLILSVVAAFAALLGGFLAIGNRDKLNLTLGFTAGIILGLVVFDLLPEVFKISDQQNFDIVWPMVSLAAGFLAFHIIEKAILIHSAQEKRYGEHSHPHIGLAGAFALSGHSFLDGMSIGLGFQASTAVGIAIAIAVIGHRFVDGFNTINVMLFHKNKISTAKRMLLIAAVMPVLGGLASLLFTLSSTVLAMYLGFFAGFLLYIGAGDILPQAHSGGSSAGTIAMTLLGVTLMFVVAQLA